MNNRNKLKLAIIVMAVTIVLLITGIVVFAYIGSKKADLYYHNIKIQLDGKEILPVDANGNVVEPFIIDGTTYLPVRGISSALGLDVAWNEQTQTVVLATPEGEEVTSVTSAETVEATPTPTVIPTQTPVPTSAPTPTPTPTPNNMQGEIDPMKAIVTMKTVTVDKTDAKKPVVTIEMESGAVMKAELYPDVAPITVENFISLIEKGFYNGLTFHRNIPGFVIQGGCPLGNGTGGPGYTIKGEFASNGVENNLKHERGVLSMARAMAPNSAGSQFFIMHAAAPHLDGDYAAFGKIIEGMDVVDSIATSGM